MVTKLFTLPNVKSVLPYSRHVAIGFDEDWHAARGIIDCCHVVLETLSCSREMTKRWTLVLDERMLRAIHDYCQQEQCDEKEVIASLKGKLSFSNPA